MTSNGRPPRYRIEMRLTPEQWGAIEAAARHAGIAIASFARMGALEFARRVASEPPPTPFLSAATSPDLSDDVTP